MKNQIIHKLGLAKLFISTLSGLSLLCIPLSIGMITAPPVQAHSEAQTSLKDGQSDTDGLTVMKSTRNTETQIKNSVDWSDYSKFQITPVEVSFRNNWKRDFNRSRSTVSGRVTDKDMARIKESFGQIVYEKFDQENSTGYFKRGYKTEDILEVIRSGCGRSRETDDPLGFAHEIRHARNFLGALLPQRDLEGLFEVDL